MANGSNAKERQAEGEALHDMNLKARAIASSRMTGPERKEQIVEKALDVIARYGLGRATTARIAAAAGISERTLYLHFASKRDLLVAALDKVFSETRKRSFMQDGTSDLLDRLRASGVSHRLAKGELVYPLFEFFASSPQENLRDELKLQHETSITLLITLIERGKTDGVVRPDVDSEQTAWDLMALYWAGDVAYMLGFEPDERVEIMMERVINEISA